MKKPPMETLVVQNEAALAETKAAYLDHQKLAAEVEELLKVDAVTAIPSIVKRMVDSGVDPVVIAKHLVIGNREGGVLYRLSARAAHLEAHERAAEFGLRMAWQMVEPQAACVMAAGGAVWLATQFGIDRALLVAMVRGANRRPKRDGCEGYGAVDLVDHGQGGTRELLVDVIEKAALPAHAPLEMRRPT